MEYLLFHNIFKRIQNLIFQSKEERVNAFLENKILAEKFWIYSNSSWVYLEQ